MKNRIKSPKKKQSIAPVHNPVKKATNQEGVEMQNARRTAAFIWESWRKTIGKLALEEKLFAEHLPQHLNDLAARVQKEIKNPIVRDSCLLMIDNKIAEMSEFIADFKAVLNHTIKVIAHCPHQIKVLNVDSFCDWTAIVRVDKKDFEDGTATLKCDSCGGELKTADMTIPMPPKEQA